MENTYICGRLEPFFETGTEGIVWSIYDSSLPGYDGLWPLEQGDSLMIVGDTRVMWEGTIKLEYKRNFIKYNDEDYGQQAVAGFWVNGLQEDVEPDLWYAMFKDARRAILRPVASRRHKQPHPFEGSSADMEARLRTLPEKSPTPSPYAVQNQEQLYRATEYAWLSFYSNGGWSSLAQAWDFTLDETLTLIGSPTTEQVEKWKLWPKTAYDSLRPLAYPTFTRLALLYGICGGLNWKFDTKDERVRWLADGRKELLLRPELDGIMQIRDMVYPIRT